MHDKLNNPNDNIEKKPYCTQYSEFIKSVLANGHPCFDAPERHKNNKLQNTFLPMGSKMDEYLNSLFLCQSLNSRIYFLREACDFEKSSKDGYSK